MVHLVYVREWNGSCLCREHPIHLHCSWRTHGASLTPGNMLHTLLPGCVLPSFGQLQVCFFRLNILLYVLFSNAFDSNFFVVGFRTCRQCVWWPKLDLHPSPGKSLWGREGSHCLKHSSTIWLSCQEICFLKSSCI